MKEKTISVQEEIKKVCEEVKELLLEKNRKYGNSALEPVRVFSKQDNLEQLKVRIDDKLSRIQTTPLTETDEDTLMDLIGYLVLYKVALKQEGKASPIAEEEPSPSEVSLNEAFRPKEGSVIQFFEFGTPSVGQNGKIGVYKEGKIFDLSGQLICANFANRVKAWNYKNIT